MSGVSDAEVSRIYESFKGYIERELRDANNPNLAPCAFHQMVEPSLTHILIHLTGIEHLNIRKMDRKLSKFPDGGAALYQEEAPDGKPNYWVEIPIPKHSKRRHHNRGRGRSPRRRHVSHVIDPDKPSCIKMLIYVIILLIIGMLAALGTTRADWLL